MIIYFYVVLMVICLFFILLNTRKLIKNLNRLQSIYFKWINKFQVSTFKGKIEILASIFFFGLITYWLMFENKENYGYAAIFFFLLTLVNYPKWFIIFGKNGIIIENNFISWDKVKNWKINRDDNFLEILYGSEYSETKIRIAHKFLRDCENLLSQNTR